MGGATGGAQQGGSTTTTQAPYAPYQPYIGTALGQASNLLQSGGPQYYPGQQVAGFNSVQDQAFKNTNNVDNNLTQGSGNPYENQMFQQELQTAQPQIASEFAGSGRDISGGMPLATQQAATLGSQFYGNQYQNDAQNAMAAGSQQQQLGGTIQNQSQNLINASMNAYNYNQELPYKNLGSFESFLGGVQPGSQTSNPFFTNPTANALGTGLGIEQLFNGMGSSGSSSGSAKPSQGVSGSPFADGQAGG